MAKGNKKGNNKAKANKDLVTEVMHEEDDKTIIYMIVGFCVGAIIALLCFEYFWVGVGGGAGMLVGILISTIVDYRKAKKAKAENKKNRKK